MNNEPQPQPPQAPPQADLDVSIPCINIGPCITISLPVPALATDTKFYILTAAIITVIATIYFLLSLHDVHKFLTWKMATWKDDYFAALEFRDKTEKANIEIYEAYTRLADRTAELSQTRSPDPVSDNTSTQPPPSTLGKRSGNVTSSPAAESLTQMRQDLTKAQQDRRELQIRLDAVMKELESLRTKSKVDTKRVSQLSAGVTQMTVRLRDREEELRGKAKLVEDVQDEMVSLNLQLNIAEEQTEMLKKENKELVDRWMARKAKEADAMNDESKFR